MRHGMLSQSLALLLILILIVNCIPSASAQSFGDALPLSPEEKRIEREQMRLHEYLHELKLEISQNWTPRRLTAQRRAVIGFEIIPAGPRIRNIRVFSSSGVQNIDKEALQAVARVTKLRPLPDEVNGPIPVNIHFMEALQESQYSYENEPKNRDQVSDRVNAWIGARDTEQPRILKNGKWFAEPRSSGSTPPADTWTEMIKKKWNPVRTGHAEYVNVTCKLNHSGRVGPIHLSRPSPNTAVNNTALRAVSEAIPISNDLADDGFLYATFCFESRPTDEKQRYFYHSHGDSSPSNTIGLSYRHYPTPKSNPTPESKPRRTNLVDIKIDQIIDFLSELFSIPRTQSSHVISSQDSGTLLNLIEGKIDRNVEKAFEAGFNASVNFRLKENGEISDVQIEKTSEDRSRYSAIVSAIENSAPHVVIDQPLALSCTISRNYFKFPLSNEMHELLAGYTMCGTSASHYR